jgi:glycosidase
VQPGDVDDARHRAVHEHLGEFVLRGPAGRLGGEYGGVALAGEGLPDDLRERREDGVVQLGGDEADQALAALPQPAEWKDLTVEAQKGDAASTLEFYRRALAVRREHPALGAGRQIAWLDAPEGVLAFRRDSDRGSFVCTVNFAAGPVTLATPGTLLLAGADVRPGAAETVLPGECAVWWAA